MAFLMGIGGYYMITKVQSSIQAGSFSTNLHCTFTQNGSPISRLDTSNDDPFVETCARAAEFIQSPNSSPGATPETPEPPPPALPDPAPAIGDDAYQKALMKEQLRSSCMLNPSGNACKDLYD